MSFSSLFIYTCKKYSGINPNTQKEQSINLHQRGSPRIAPQIKAKGITPAQAIIAKYTIQIFRTGLT